MATGLMRRAAALRLLEALVAGPARDLACHGLFLLLAALLFRDALLHGRIQWQEDSQFFYFPLLSTVAAALRQGRLSLWTPDVMGGYPLFADGEAGMLYPFNLLALRALAPEAAVVALRVLHFALAGVFTYSLLRALGSGRFGGVVAGAAFMLSGFLVAQVVHSNVSAGLIWLPLVLYFIEKAAQTRGSGRLRYAMCGGVILSVQALAVHLQVCLMTALVAGPYLALRMYCNETLAPLARPWRLFPVRVAGRGFLLLGMGIILGATAVGLAAVQLLPLYELAELSARGGGLAPRAATINSVSPFGLAGLLLPHLFEGSDGLYLGYWVQWEKAIYAGQLTLLLAVVGAIFHRGRAGLFFGGVALVALVLSLGRYGPPLVQQAVQLLLGDHGLRSPGRFGGLFDFSLAVLAGLGAHWLDQRLPHTGRVDRVAFRVFAVLAGLAVAGGLLAVHAVQDFLQVSSGAAQRWLAGHYLALDPEGAPQVSATVLLQQLQGALASTHPRLVLTVLLWVATFGLLVAWLWGAARQWRSTAEGQAPLRQAAAPRRPPLRGALRAVAVVLLALDLLVAADAVHPRMPVSALRPDSPAVAFLRQQLTLVPGADHGPVDQPVPEDARALWRIETGRAVFLDSFDLKPNVLLPLRISEAGGYSSLKSERHRAYQVAAEFAENRLLDVWSARYLVRRNRPWSLPSHELTPFHPGRPLLSGSGENTGAGARYRIPSVTAVNVRVVTHLRDAWLVPQDEAVAEIAAYDAGGERLAWRLRAGRETAEATYDWERHREQTQHARPAPVFSWTETEAESGTEQPVHLYYAELPLDRPRDIVALEVHVPPLASVPDTIVRIYGLAVGVPNWETKAAEWWMDEKYRLVYEDAEMRIFENRRALPRAYLVPAGVEVPVEAHLKQMAERAFDPEQIVLVEPLDRQGGAAEHDPPAPPLLSEWPPPMVGQGAQGEGQARPASDLRAESARQPGLQSDHSCALPSVDCSHPSGTAATAPSDPEPLVSAGDPTGRIAWSPAGRAEVLHYRGERVVVAVDAATASWLFLGDTYYPGWRAYVDGIEQSVLQANSLFRAVPVPRGGHLVEFRFESWSVQLGALISVATGLAVLLVASLALAARVAVRRCAFAPPGDRRDHPPKT